METHSETLSRKCPNMYFCEIFMKIYKCEKQKINLLFKINEAFTPVVLCNIQKDERNRNRNYS